jgi:hypothetical protein
LKETLAQVTRDCPESVEVARNESGQVFVSGCDAWPRRQAAATARDVSPRVTGVLLPLLPVNDTWVFRLVLEKVGVETPQDQGADITVTSHPPGTPDLSTA